MPAGQFVKVVIPLYYEGHAYRAGSRIRVTIAAPNGTQPVWSFAQTEPDGTATSRSPSRRPCRPAWSCRSSRACPCRRRFPACPSLRNEPCRPYLPMVNRTPATSTGAAGATPQVTGTGSSVPLATGAGGFRGSSPAGSMGLPSQAGSNGVLALTGAELIALIIGALVLLGLGTFLAISMRRRSGQPPG